MSGCVLPSVNHGEFSNIAIKQGINPTLNDHVDPEVTARLARFNDVNENETVVTALKRGPWPERWALCVGDVQFE